MKKNIKVSKVPKMQNKEDRSHSRRAMARKEAKGKREAAKEKTEHVGLVEEQDTLQRGVERAATETCTPLMKMRLKTLKKHLTMMKSCRRRVRWKIEKNEQWQEVISRRDKHKVQKANETSLSEWRTMKIICGDAMKLKSVVNAQTMLEESATCIAVKKDRPAHHEQCYVDQRIAEPWTIERGAQFIDLLGYPEITPKSDMGPAIIAFRSRVADMCKAEITTEDAVKRDTESNGLVENTVMPIQNHQMSHWKLHTRTTQWRITHSAEVGGTCGMHLVQMSKGRDEKPPFKRLHGKEPLQELVPAWWESVGNAYLQRSHEQNESQIHVLKLARNAKQQCRTLHWECRWCIQSSWNHTLGTAEQTGQRSRQDSRCTVDRPEIRMDPNPIPPVPFEGARIQRGRITRQDIE